MAPSTFKTAALEKAYTTRILLILYHQGPMKKTALYRQITSNTASLLRRVTELVDDGLLTVMISTEHPFTHILTLTPKGRAMAEHLAMVEDILSTS